MGYIGGGPMAFPAGVRELKNRLSHYLCEVKRGRSITVTERGKTIAFLVPVNDDPDIAVMRELARRGVVSWKGGKPRGVFDPMVQKGKPLSKIILEDRG